MSAPIEYAAPPPGPGVQPPFAAPPADGNRKRLWIGLGIGGAVLLLCCVGGVLGFGALVVSTSSERVNQARTVVTKYLTAWENRDYSGAYQLLCEVQKRRDSPDAFAQDLSDHPLAQFTVATPKLATNTITVPAQLIFHNGVVENDRFNVTIDTAAGGTGSSQVCGRDQ